MEIWVEKKQLPAFWAILEQKQSLALHPAWSAALTCIINRGMQCFDLAVVEICSDGLCMIHAKYILLNQGESPLEANHFLLTAWVLFKSHSLMWEDLASSGIGPYIWVLVHWTTPTWKATVEQTVVWQVWTWR